MFQNLLNLVNFKIERYSHFSEIHSDSFVIKYKPVFLLFSLNPQMFTGPFCGNKNGNILTEKLWN